MFHYSLRSIIAMLASYRLKIDFFIDFFFSHIFPSPIKFHSTVVQCIHL